MRRRRRILIAGGVALAAVWAVAAVGILYAQSRIVTAGAVLDYLVDQPLSTLDGAGRAQRIAGLAERVRRLDIEQRKDGALADGLRDAFLEMTDEERHGYLDLTLPSGFAEMVEAFNEMPREERRRRVDEAVAHLRDGAGPGAGTIEEEVGTDVLDRIVSHGMKAYITDASAQAKLDAQPLILELQARMRKLHQ